MDTETGAAESQRSSSPENGTYKPLEEPEDDYDSTTTGRRKWSQDGEYKVEPGSSDWDLDTDDIRSVSSTELREARPNRWKGPASTWRALTEQDRLTYEALVSLRNQDLTAHLYTAFALKRRRQLEGSGDADTDNDAEDEEDGDFDAVTGVRVRDSDWVPPKAWTAWPLRSHLVPQDYELMKASAPGDSLDPHTLRRISVPGEESSRPGTALQEMLCATMLQTATNRLRRRQALGHVDSENNAIYQQTEEERPVTPSSQYEDGEWPNGSPPSAQLHSSSPAPPSSTVPVAKEKNYTPTAATDDDKSYALLRPAARRILESLDATLLRLHDARICATMDLSEPSGTSSSEQHDDMGQSGQILAPSDSRRRKRGRPRSAKHLVLPKFMRPERPRQGSKPRMGRPKKAYTPCDGETEKEMMIRVARERHEKIPVYSDDEEEHSRKEALMGERSATSKLSKSKSRRTKGKVILKLEGETERQYQVRVAREKHLKLPEFLSDEGPTPQDAASSPTPDLVKQEFATEMELDEELTAEEAAERKLHGKKKSMSRWPLRDWGDVVGAAALAGFSPAVIARATQRCANLFGQTMEMHTIAEVPAAGGRKRKRPGMVTKAYRPGGALSETSLTSGGEDTTDAMVSDSSAGRIRMQRLRSLSREPSLRSKVPTASSSDEEAKQDANPKSRARRAGTSALIIDSGFWCPHATCTRFSKAFARHVNLVRHLKLVHGEVDAGRRTRSRSRSRSRGAAQSEVDGEGGGQGEDESEGEEDSAGEMDGAVHVDGFLRPIKIRSGWRAEDVVKRKEKINLGNSRRQGRSRRRRLDSDGYES